MQETGGRRARARRQGAGITFRVGYVIDHELAYEAVVFDDGSSGDGLSIQRALVTDEQDVALGMDTYCVCLSSGPAVYGGVEAWSAHDGEIRLRLSEEAASELGIPGELAFSAPREELAPVVHHLARLLG